LPELNTGNRRLRLAAALSVLVSFAGAVWSLAAEETCADCDAAARLLGDFPLAWVGVAYYGVLFAAMLGKNRSNFAALGILAAASAHVVLLGILAFHRIACSPCILTAAGAVLAAGFCLASHKPNMRRAFVVVPVALLLAFVGYKAMRVNVVRAYRREADRLLAALVREHPRVTTGKARMVAYVRPKCVYCGILKTELVPALKKEFKGVLLYEERLAPDGAAVPTVIVLGTENKAFMGLPPLKELSRAIQKACRTQPTSP